MRLSVVVPVFNEEGNLCLLCERVGAVARSIADDYEIILVNDGSTDNSFQVMRDLERSDQRIKYISLSRNFGHEVASTAGLDAATGDAVVLMDADLQDPPELIRDMVNKWKQGVEVVFARRRIREGETAIKRATAYLFYRILNRLSDVSIPLDTGDFRLMDRRVVDALRQCRESPRFIRGLVSWVGFRQEAVLYDRAQRHSGETKYDLFKLMRLSWEAMCAFSLTPLRLVMWLGCLVTLCSLALAVVVAVQRLFFGLPVQGYALLACGLFLLGGIQLTLLGFMARYIGYVFIASQRRPLYIIAEMGGFKATDGCKSLSGNV